MKKVHTKRKRKFSLSTHINQYRFFHKAEISHRPKSFATESQADKWAAANGLKPGQYELRKVKRGKRFEVSVLKSPKK